MSLQGRLDLLIKVIKAAFDKLKSEGASQARIDSRSGGLLTNGTGLVGSEPAADGHPMLANFVPVHTNYDSRSCKLIALRRVPRRY